MIYTALGPLPMLLWYSWRSACCLVLISLVFSLILAGAHIFGDFLQLAASPLSGHRLRRITCRSSRISTGAASRRGTMCGQCDTCRTSVRRSQATAALLARWSKLRAQDNFCPCSSVAPRLHHHVNGARVRSARRLCVPGNGCVERSRTRSTITGQLQRSQRRESRKVSRSQTRVQYK